MLSNYLIILLCACNKLSNIFSSHVCFTKNRNETKFPFNKKLCKMFVFVYKPEELLGKSWEKRQFTSSSFFWNLFSICIPVLTDMQNKLLFMRKPSFASKLFCKVCFCFAWCEMMKNAVQNLNLVVILFRKGLRACSYKPKVGIWLYGFVQLHL